MRRRHIILAIVSIAVGVLAALLVPKPLPAISRDELMAEVRSGNVHSVVIVDKEVLTAVSARRGPFRVDLKKADKTLIEELSTLGVEVKYETTPLGLI